MLPRLKNHRPYNSGPMIFQLHISQMKNIIDKTFKIHLTSVACFVKFVFYCPKILTKISKYLILKLIGEKLCIYTHNFLYF